MDHRADFRFHQALLAVALSIAGVGCSSAADPRGPGEPPGATCAPTGGGPYWLSEGETLTFALACQSQLALPGNAFSIAPLPPGATYDPETKTVVFTPGLDQAAVYELLVTATPTGETAAVKIGVADAWDDPANVPVIDPERYGEEYGLPVLFLSPDPQTDEYAPATVTYRGRTREAEAKLRGSTSLSYPKHSYTLKFPKGDLFDEPEWAGGFLGKRRIVLISTFDDNSYIRQRLAYDLWNRLDPQHLRIQTYSAVVYLDGHYLGLYTVADHVDADLLAAHGLRRDGNLYKAISHDANFRLTDHDGAPKATPHDGYEKHEGSPPEGEPGAFQDLDDLVTFVATSAAPDFVAGIGERIDVRDYGDWWILTTFLLADDSAGKNSYHYHDPAGGPFRCVPWDFNHSAGQTWLTEREPASVVEEYVEVNHLFERFLEEPPLGDPLRARYRDVLHGAFALDDVLALVDGYVAEIDASARRDEAMWQESYTTYGPWSSRNDFTSYEEEIVYVKAWLEERWSHQDALY